MEEPQILDYDNDALNESDNLYYTSSLKALLSDTGKYATLTATLFVVNVVVGLASSFYTTQGLGGLFATLLVGMLFNLIIYGLFIYFTYQFGNSVKKGLEADAIDIVEEGFPHLKRYFKALGILMLIPLGIMVLAFLFLGTASSF